MCDVNDCCHGKIMHIISSKCQYSVWEWAGFVSCGSLLDIMVTWIAVFSR